MTEVESILGLPKHLDIKDDDGRSHSFKIWPVRLCDWESFNQCNFILSLDSLHEIFIYGDGFEYLKDVLRIVLRRDREDELQDILELVTQKQYAELRQMIIEQNDLRFRKKDEVDDSKKMD